MIKLRLRKPVWDEKRGAQRIELEGTVTWQVPGERRFFRQSWSEECPAVMMKPSILGMRLSVDKELPQEGPVRICVPDSFYGGTKPLYLYAEVVWKEASARTGRIHHGLRLLEGHGDHSQWAEFILMKLREQVRDPEFVDFSS